MYQIKLKMELFDAFKMELLFGWRSSRCHHDVTVYIFVIRDISFIKFVLQVSYQDPIYIGTNKKTLNARGLTQNTKICNAQFLVNIQISGKYTESCNQKQVRDAILSE